MYPGHNISIFKVIRLLVGFFYFVSVVGYILFCIILLLCMTTSRLFAFIHYVLFIKASKLCAENEAFSC